MEKLNLDSIKARIKGETPKFFKTVIKIMIGCTVLGGGLIAAKSQYPQSFEWLSDSFGGYLITIGLVGTLISGLTVNNNGAGEKAESNV